MKSLKIILFWITLTVFCLTSNIVCDSVKIAQLSSNWTLTNQNRTITKTSVNIPSGVYSELYGEDVLNSYNDVNMRWIAHDNWTYTNTFSLNPSDLRNNRFVNLTLHGIDTVAEIRLNHVFLGRTDNMFVRYTYDITKILESENLLEIEIQSPIYAALKKANEIKENKSYIPPNCPIQRYNGECHMNLLRKMQASFAWDWGLAAPSMGIWKSIDLEYYEVAILRDIDVAVSKNDTHWNMHVRVFMDAHSKEDFSAQLTFYAIELSKNAIVLNKTLISYKDPMIVFDMAVPKDNIELWWPNGHGNQKLYPLHVTLKAWLPPNGPALRNKFMSQKSIRIGFRTIELVENPASNGHGNTFLFKVNDKEIFMKGSNYIPSHILPELCGDKARIKHLLKSAKDSHQNMIRVWGGGIYESDYFYELADYYGILIWQDMMFACAMYPASPEFLSSVSKEIIQNAKRLAYHPSIAIMATNNENEAALAQDWYETLNEKERFKAEYRRLYLGTVIHELKIIQHVSRPRPLVSSPSNGKESQKDNYISDDPQNSNYGDVHFYDIFKDGWNPAIYPRARFVSEYGFQSLPSIYSWKRSMNENDSLVDLINHRQHHPMGMLAITALVRRHLPLPLDEDDNYAEALIYFSQIAQAMATKVETELYRSLRDTEHQTMGALFWQLNDVWIAPSWSAIDFYGNYKLLYYWSKDFLAPIAIVALFDSGSKSLNVSLVCDNFKVEATHIEVTMNIYKWSDLFPQKSTTWPAMLKPNGVHYDKVIPIADIFKDDFTTSNSFVEFILEQNSLVKSRTFYFPTSIAAAQGIRKDPQLDLQISYKYCSTSPNLKTNSYSLTVTSKYPALFVYIEVTHPQVRLYRLSQNGFMQTSGVTLIHLEFESTECITLKRNNINLKTVNQYMR